MNYLQSNKLLKRIITTSDGLVSMLILVAIVAVIILIILQIVSLFTSVINNDLKNALFSIAIVIVLVKAYRILFFYMESHHVSVKYIVEISIIAPAVELIFATENRSLELNILLGLYSIASSIIYLSYYRKLCDSDDKSLTEQAPY